VCVREFIFANKTRYVANVLGVNYQVCVSDNMCVCVCVYVYNISDKVCDLLTHNVVTCRWYF